MEDQWLRVSKEHRLKKGKTKMVKQHEYDEVDNVNSPEHYNNGGKIECIEYLEDFLSREEYIGYLRGNIAKYMHRWRRKNGLEDLKKAEWYGARLIALVEKGGA